MVDIHCHILYGVDDGSDDLAETVEMLRLAERGGTVKVIATPHSNVPGSYRNYWCAELESRLALINSELKREGVGIEVIDLRSLSPVDWETVEASVRRTGRPASRRPSKAWGLVTSCRRWRSM